MKKLVLLAVVLVAATSLGADEAVKRTLVVRDGKVIIDDGLLAGKRAFIGVAVTELTPELREFFGAPKDAGVLISSVSANGPAAKAGLRVGDVITTANGQNVVSRRDLTKALKDKHAGDAVRLEVIRSKARQSIVATAEERAMPVLDSVFDLGDLPRELGTSLDGKKWQAWVASPGTEDLRARLRDLETRLQELEKRLKEK